MIYFYIRNEIILFFFVKLIFILLCLLFINVLGILCIRVIKDRFVMLNISKLKMISFVI